MKVIIPVAVGIWRGFTAFCPTVLAVLANCHINLWPPMELKMEMMMMMKITVSAAACFELCSTYSALAK